MNRLIAAGVGLGALAAASALAQDASQRMSLPIAPAPFAGVSGRTLDTSRPAWSAPVSAPAGAPNVIVVLLDDAGFGNPSTFGGPVSTPTLDRLAQDGLRYNAFHVTALCSPTRAALLTGRNHHAVGFGSVAELPSGWPGYDAQWPRSAASVARILQENGYATSVFGKWHLTPSSEFGPAGPFSRWPRAQGFDYFWGFLAGDTDQYEPLLFENDINLGTPKEKDFYLNTALTDRALGWLAQVRSTAPQKPFFMYYSTGASHAPHQVPAAWSDKYKGKFDQGWDRLREETFARQKKLGVVPQDATLPPRDAAFPEWSSLSAEERQLMARQMEVYAGFQENTDHEIGRLIAGVEALGLGENTLIFYIFGDNGASLEGTETGSFNEMVVLNGLPLTSAQQLEAIKAYGGLGVWGGPRTMPHYAAAWAWAGNTPFQWGKQVASHLGGTRNPLVVRWPSRITDKNGLRSQFTHVTDVAPTILEAAGVPAPQTVDGVPQQVVDGRSFLSTFADAKAPSTRGTQYFEILGNRALYRDGWWLACRAPRVPWKLDAASLARIAPGAWKPDEDPCELYDLNTDFTQSRDLAGVHPDKVRELREVFWQEAERNKVLPLMAPLSIAFGPQYTRPRPAKERFTYLPGVENLSPGLVPRVYNRSFAIDANIEVSRNDCIFALCRGAEGVLVAEGDYLGGFSLYVLHGKPRFTYSFLGLKFDTITSSETLPTGKVTVRFAFTADDPDKRATGGTGRLFINGRQVAEGRIERTVPLQFTSHAGMDIGRDNGRPVVTEVVYAFERPFATQTKIISIDFELE